MKTNRNPAAAGPRMPRSRHIAGTTMTRGNTVVTRIYTLFTRSFTHYFSAREPLSKSRIINELDLKLTSKTSNIYTITPRKTCLHRGVFYWALSLFLLACGQAAEPKNILFCIADDWSWPHAGVFGDKVVRTPNIGRLAREGMLFT